MTLDKVQSFSTHSPHPKSDIPTFKCTDLGNAERLKHYFGDQLRYCHPWSKWACLGRNQMVRG